MINKVQIKTTYGDGDIHLSSNVNEYTICGLDMGGDSSRGYVITTETNQKINCPECLNIINLCRLLKTSE